MECFRNYSDSFLRHFISEGPFDARLSNLAIERECSNEVVEAVSMADIMDVDVEIEGPRGTKRKADGHAVPTSAPRRIKVRE